MKYKVLAISLLLAGAGTAAFAQEAEKKWTDNMYVGAGVGIMSVFNDGMNSPTFNINVQVGKNITPTWGVRGVLSGAWQSLETQSSGYSNYCKTFGELNLDATLNLINLFGGYNPDRKVDFYLFGGPTLNLSRAVSGRVEFAGEDITAGIGQTTTVELEPNAEYAYGGAKVRVGATVGLGLAYNINENWAVNLEARAGVTPSIFGMGSDCRKAEATGRLNVGFAYTFGGKNFTPATAKVDQTAINDEVNKYRAELAQAQTDLANTKNALANAQKETVTKEVIKEVQVAGPRAIFFKLGSAQIDDYGKVNIQLAAKILKANPDKKYKIAGYADKATGSSAVNQKLSERRAQAVYDALIAEGVDENQIELVGFGGTDNMFGKDYLNRVVIME